MNISLNDLTHRSADTNHHTFKPNYSYTAEEEILPLAIITKLINSLLVN